MLRTLFFGYPEDPTSRLVEDEYMFGEDILVAPLVEDVAVRDVYLPPGFWVSYQSGQRYGAAIPHVRLAQSTAEMDWREIELRVFGAGYSAAKGWFCLPEEGALHALRLEYEGDDFVLKEDSLQGKVEWKIRTHG